MVKIIPSLLVSSEEEFKQQITAVQDYIDMVQIDIADGKFVPNTTWSYPQFVDKVLEIGAELHLMVEEPQEKIEKWKNVDKIERVLFHYEATDKIDSTVKKIKESGWQAGIVINPDTEVKQIEKYIDQVDSVMFMGVKPGFQGQELIPKVLEGIKEFKQKYPDTFTEIDGSVNEQTLPEIVKTDVNAVCPGSAIFSNEHTPKENIVSMKKLITRLKAVTQ